MPKLLKDMVIEEVSLVDDPANEEARVVLVKARRGNETAANAADDEDDNMPDMDEIQKALTAAEETITKLDASLAIEKARGDKAEARVSELQALVKERDSEIAKAKAVADPKAAEEEFLKALPEAARKRLLDAEAELVKSREKAEIDEAIAKARSFAPGDEEAKTIGGLLLRVRKGTTTADDADTIEAVLKRANASTGRSDFFKQFGKNTSQAAVTDDPDAFFKSKAAEIKKADPDLSDAQAYAKAVEQNPEVYDTYIAKRRGAAA